MLIKLVDDRLTNSLNPLQGSTPIVLTNSKKLINKKGGHLVAFLYWF